VLTTMRVVAGLHPSMPKDARVNDILFGNNYLSD